MATIQDAVKDHVKQNHTTKDAFAQEVGINRTTFYAKLRGASDFTLSEAYRLSRALGCSIDDLYTMTQA